MRRTIFALFLVGVPLLPAAAEEPFRYYSARQLAMGGTGAAWANPADAPLQNPAWYALQRSSFTAVRMMTAANGDGWKLFTGLKGDLADASRAWPGTVPDAALLERAGQLDARYTLTGPVFAAYYGNGYGLAVLNNSSGRTTLTGTVEPVCSFSLNSDITAVAGLGIPIPLLHAPGQELLFGINLKYVTRFQYSAQNLSFSQLHTAIDPLDKQIPYRLGQAIGSDFGIIFRSGKITAGMVWQDWFRMTFSWKQYNADDDQLETELPNTQVTGRIHFGFSYLFDTVFGLSRDYFSRTRVSFDLRNILIKQESFFLRLHLGFETTLFHTLTVRTGFNQGYFTGGLAYTLLETVTLEYTYAGEEAGDYPGQQRIGWHAFSVTVTF